MDVGDLLRRLVRRKWYVVVVALIAVVAAGISWTTAGSSQQSGAAVVIVPPPLGDAVSDQNPLLNLSDNLSQLAVVLSGAMRSADATALLRARGATGSFDISTVTGTNPSFSQLSPQLVFTATGPTAAGVERTSSALVAVARDRLAALQATADVPDSSRATLLQTVGPTKAEAVGGGRLRAAGSIGLAIVVLGLVLVLAWDEIVRRRRERQMTRWRAPRKHRRLRRGAGDDAATDEAAPVAFRSR